KMEWWSNGNQRIGVCTQSSLSDVIPTEEFPHPAHCHSEGAYERRISTDQRDIFTITTPGTGILHSLRLFRMTALSRHRERAAEALRSVEGDA
ncbi:hypothetical protein KKC74_01080, partial [bacterium]|nr:hypothetical protein [bacterium]